MRERASSIETLSSTGSINSQLSTVKGHRAHYLATGAGQPVLLLHGGASDSTDWKPTMESLSGSCSLYAPDLIGYGRSDHEKEEYCLSDFVDFVAGFSDSLDLECPVLVGHSLGGRICLEMALRNPEKIKGLVLVNAAAFSKLALWGSCIGTFIWGARKVLRRKQPYPKFAQENGGYGQWVCLDRLPQLNIPTLIVWSKFDPYYGLSGALEAVKLIPGARLEILPCRGHAPHIRERERFNALLLKFLKECDNIS